MNKLVEKLWEAGAFADEQKDFYFWNTDPYNWSDISYQARSVKNTIFNMLPESVKYLFSPQYLAFGDFTINAIPEGYVQPKGNGRYEICVNKIYLFINDIFNFEGNEPLGRWNLRHISGDYLMSFDFEASTLGNSEFRYFQRHGYGRYFPVLSKLHEVENFQPQCREYSYVK